jgi:pyruvate/2-oxoglutarate dehydrogenase complex dihydrolipoamide acyltransferase (E2) component
VNASIDLEREEITLHTAYNIGIATATPDGPIVPVVHDADGRACRSSHSRWASSRAPAASAAYARSN